MNRTLTMEFNVYISDDIEEKIAEYYHESIEDVSDEDIKEYIELNIHPATSDNPCFEVEGGDTDGWFIQSFRW